jgi:hypothetical protein
MILWYLAGSVVAVWNVFQSGGLDFRLVALGAIAPLVVDAPFGEMAYAHALVAPVALLAATMVLTAGRGRRLLRRRALGLPIGWFCGLALSGAFTHTEVFWWPFAGSLEDASLLPPLPVLLVLEALGVLAARWCWVRFDLGRHEQRRAFLTTGRLAC